MLKIINPATEAVIRELEEDTQRSIEQKYQRARAAQKKWAQTPLQARLEAIRKFRDLVAERKEKLAATLTSEMGKPIAQARNELNALGGRIDFFLEKAAAVLRDEEVFNDQGMVERISHEPLGVIANISAWNYPYFVGSNVFVPGLLAGNTVLFKPSEFSTLTGLAIAELLHQAGVPEDAFIPVVGTGTVGAQLLAQPVNGVFFTGSYATGRKINETVAGRLIKTQLELGGKDPARKKKN